MKKKFSAVAIALFALAILAVPSAQAQSLLVGFDYDSNTGTGGGDSVLDVSGWGTTLDGVIQGSSTLVVDATRPGAGAGNLVLSTGVVGIGAYSPDNDRLDTQANGLTYVTWYKSTPDNPANFAALIGRGSQATRVFQIQDANGDGVANLAISNGDNAEGAFQFANLTPKINDGEWHHIAVVFDPTGTTPNIRGYLDGALGTSGVPEWNPDNAAGLFGLIGGSDTTGAGPVTSLVDRSNGFDVGGRSEDNGDRIPNAWFDDSGMFRGVLSDNGIEDLASGAKSIADFAVPEPATVGLLGSALVGMLLTRRRR